MLYFYKILGLLLKEMGHFFSREILYLLWGLKFTPQYNIKLSFRGFYCISSQIGVCLYIYIYISQGDILQSGLAQQNLGSKEKILYGAFFICKH